MGYSTTTSISTISGHSKVTLPHEEAVKAPFPPSVKVLCFDENGFRVGVVKNVLVFISLHEETTSSYGTYYEVEIKGANLQSGKTSVYTASDLRLTPDCPVCINPEYFGSVFKNVESEGNVEGIILGSFEIPPSMCSNCTDMHEGSPKRGKYFYSVRVRLPGIEEAVEAHGVPPEYIMVLPNNGGGIYNSLSFTSASIVIGGGSYGDDSEGIDHHDAMRSRNTRGPKPRRVAPENMRVQEDFDNESVREGYFQDQYENNMLNEPYQENIRPPKTIQNIISNPHSHFYEDTTAGSESDTDKLSTVRQSRSLSRQRDSSRSRQTSNRSVSRTRTYLTSQSPIRMKPQNERSDNDNLTQNYGDFKEHRSNMDRNNRIITSNDAVTNDYRNYESYDDRANDSRYGNSGSEEEYDIAIFDASGSGNDKDHAPADDPYDQDDTEENLHSSQHGNNSIGHQSFQSSAQQSYQLSNPESRASTPSRQKAFGKTWSPSSNQHEEDSLKSEVNENRSIGKLHIGAKASTPLKVRSITPVAPSPKALSTSKIPDSIPEEGCYLNFDAASGGRFVTQFSHTVIEDAIGFWAPGEGKKIQGFKFKQNQGRSDLMKGIAGKDYKKKYFSGWCQFVKAAKSYDGFLAKYSEKERIEVDVYVFFHENCAIEKVEDGKLFDVSSISAVACVAKGNNTFEGVKTGEYGTFLNRGDAAGASLAV